LVSAPILTIPSGSGGFVVYSDASHQGLGCVLMQHGRVVAYASRQLKTYEGTTLLMIWNDEILRFGTRLCVPNDEDLRRELLEEAHCSKFAIHPGGTKMYKDLRQNYWWSGMKRDIAQFVAQCLVCQQVKAEHQRPAGSLQPLVIPEWKFWHSLQKALGTKLSFTTAFHPQTDGQSERVIQVLEDLLRACILDLQGNWDDHLPLVEFAYNNSFQASIGMTPFEALYGEIWSLSWGDHVFLKVSPMKSVMRFGRKGKLSPRFVVGAYSNFEDLTYEEVPVQIVDVMDKVLRHAVVKLVKVQWSNHSIQEATWELE
ncbi:Transposon Ty3-I Gag-Pol polyprotein, partial [Vitis vinifera]